MRALAAAALIALSSPVAAQSSTDIFLVDLTRENGRMRVQTVTRVTDRDGYDNQPQFAADGRAILYTSIDAAGQADIIRYDIASGAHAHVTSTTPESEYSATPAPGGRISVIRVEADSMQRLWSIRPDGSDARIVLPDIAPVGYHAWIDDDHLALFVLGQPATLVLATAGTGEARTVARDIGRSLHRIPGRRAVSFVQRSNGRGSIMMIDPGTGETERLVEEVEGNEFHAWMPDGTLVSAHAGMIFVWHAGDEGWTAALDLAEHGVSGISRIAVSPDGARLAVVAER